MAGTTTELALSTAVDTDDTADYLTLNLANSLRTLDALFNNVTGHTHASAHQGGPIAASSITGAIDKADWYRSTGHTTPYPGSGVGIEMYWSGTAGILQSFNRATAAYAETDIYGSTVKVGANGGTAFTVAADQGVTFAGNIGVAGASNLAGTLAVSGTSTLTGTVSANALNCTAFAASSTGSFGGQVTVTTGNVQLNNGLLVLGSGGPYWQNNGGTMATASPLSTNGTFTAGGRISGTDIVIGTAQSFLWQGGTPSIYGDASVLQFRSPSLWRFTDTGTAKYVDVQIVTLSSGASSLQINASHNVAATQGMVVGGTNLNGQSLYVNGGAGGPTGWQQVSTRRYKSSIESLPDALDIVTNDTVHGYHFQIDPPDLEQPLYQYGFIGEEWLAVAPDVVTIDTGGEVQFMDYGQVTPIIFEALKDYIARTDARLAALEAAP